MNILRATEGMTKKEIYAMSYNQGIHKMSDHANEIFQVDKMLLYEDEQDGEMVEILSILTTNGEIWATNSKTFIRDFKRIDEMFEGEDAPELFVYTGVSKNGRDFIGCSVSM